MDLLLTFVGALLLGSAAILFTRALRICGPARVLAAALVLAASLVVFESIVLSLLHELTRTGLLLAQALWLGAALVVWRRVVARGAVAGGAGDVAGVAARAAGGSAAGAVPGVPAGMAGNVAGASGSALRAPRLRALGSGVRAHPLTALLVLVLVVALGLQAFLAVAVAPNEPDSLGYHLPRAAFWLQQHTALQYHPGELNDPEAVAPPNAELLIAWTMALSRSDSFAQLVQWLSLIGTLACILAACRIVGLPRSGALFAACLFGLMPEVLLESATAQNDLVATFFLSASLLFMVIGMRERSRGALLVGALAAGLAIGTKLYAVFMLPGAIVLLVALLRSTRAQPPRRSRPRGRSSSSSARDRSTRLASRRSLLAFGAAALVLAAVGLGSFNYIQNELHTHTLSGYSGTPEGDFVKGSLLDDMGRVGWNLLDAPGLPQPHWVSHPAERVARGLFKGVRGSSFGVPSPPIREESSEDESAYGLVGLLLLVPLVLVSLLLPSAPWWQRLLAFSGFAWFMASALVLGYSPEGARYLMPAVAVCAPLLALLARRRVLAAIAAALALSTLPGALLHDVYKPLLSSEGNPSVLSMSRLRQQTIDESVAPLRLPVQRLQRLLPAKAALGFVNQDPLMEYLLFGEPLRRRLVALDGDEVTPARIRSQRLAGVFIGFRNQPPCVGRLCLVRPAGLRFVALGPNSYLVTPR